MKPVWNKTYSISSVRNTSHRQTADSEVLRDILFTHFLMVLITTVFTVLYSNIYDFNSQQQQTLVHRYDVV